MCLYPKLILNRKYLPNVKNKGQPPQIQDERTRYVPVGCGKCMECLKQKARNWQVRLHEELRIKEGNIYFVTLSFSDKALNELTKAAEKKRKKTIKKLNKLKDKRYSSTYKKLEGYTLDNAIAKLAVRRFLERWRKEYKVSVKHWLITELGQTNTERLHIHGLIWTDINKNTIEKIWQYGNIWIGDYVNEKTINYIVKYLYKTDKIHKYYTPVILTSKGIGNKYLDRIDSKNNKFNDNKTNDRYITRNGIKLPLPIYYRNKIYTDDEKEKLWLMLLDKQKRYINGIEVDISKGEEDYYRLLETQRIKNKMLGYNDDSENWEQKEYEKQRRNLQKLARIKKIK